MAESRMAAPAKLIYQTFAFNDQIIAVVKDLLKK
jgi:hypothetical protein